MTNFFFSLLFFLFVTNPVYAASPVDAQIQVKELFNIGETPSFSYVITSFENVKVVFSPNIYCEDGLNALLSNKEIDLEANLPYSSSFKGSLIDENWVSQTCTAEIVFSEPEEKVVKKEFSIKAVSASELDIVVCRDELCANPARVFYLGDTIWIKAKTNPDDVELTVNMVKPDESAEKINLPFSFVAEKNGNYVLTASFSKKGYKDAQVEAVFNITSGPAEIQSAEICKINGQCISPENIQNCPQDCQIIEKNDKTIFKNNKILVFITILFILIMLIMLIYFAFKHKNKLKISE